MKPTSTPWQCNRALEMRATILQVTALTAAGILLATDSLGQVQRWAARYS